MGIPKVIHYCWFGGGPLTETAEKCIESWKRYCTDYEIIEWNERNYDVNKVCYMREAYKAGKWAFVSDYARLDIVFSHGGIYLDTDVELIKSPDELMQEKLVLAMEKNGYKVATGLGFAAEKGNLVLKELISQYDGVSFIYRDGSLNLKTTPQYVTEYFLERGYTLTNQTQRIGSALILSSDYLCPMDYITGIITTTEHTIGIHWYEASWFGTGDKEIRNKERKIRKHVPVCLAKILCIVYRKSYRLIEYMRKGILLEQIMKKIKRR